MTNISRTPSAEILQSNVAPGSFEGLWRARAEVTRWPALQGDDSASRAFTRRDEQEERQPLARWEDDGGYVPAAAGERPERSSMQESQS